MSNSTISKIMEKPEKSMIKSSSAPKISPAKPKIRTSFTSQHIDNDIQNKSKMFRSTFWAEEQLQKKDWLIYAKVYKYEYSFSYKYNLKLFI